MMVAAYKNHLPVVKLLLAHEGARQTVDDVSWYVY